MKYKLKENATEDQLAECEFKENVWSYFRSSKKKWTSQFISKITKEIQFCVSDGKSELKDYIADLINKGYVEVVE